MLDVNLFREERGNNPDVVRESQRRRFASVEIVDSVIALDKKWRELQFSLEALRKDANKIDKAVRQRKLCKEDASDLIAQKKELMTQIQDQESKMQEAKALRDSALESIGNLVHDSVPVSNNEDDNEVINQWGTCRNDAGLRSHVDLIKDLEIVDLVRGTEVAGSRGYFLKGYGVRLNLALIAFSLDFLLDRNFTLVQTPFFMTKDAMGHCAQLSQFDEELYKISGEGDDKYLIATSEQPLCAYHRKERLDPKSLPLKYGGYSSCFRKEVGSHGRDTLGIFRVHQFEKVEQFCLTSPDESWDMHKQMLKNCEEFYQMLGLPYRVVSIVSGALNNAAAKKYDLEAWFPASQMYRELVSCSNCTDYQSRNMEIRYGQPRIIDQDKQYVHLLNSTLTATQRTICCILENYQTSTGVKIPEALQPYMGGVDFLPFPSCPAKQPKHRAKRTSMVPDMNAIMNGVKKAYFGKSMFILGAIFSAVSVSAGVALNFGETRVQTNCLK